MNKIDEILDISDDIRYVAIYENNILEKKTKSSVENTSGDDSDTFEELLVNPTLLMLTEQRGNIDCGGLDYLIITYGNFYQLVKRLKQGHISIAIKKEGNPIALYSMINKRLNEWKR